MKRLLIIFFFAIASASYAQQYKSLFGDSLTSWNIILRGYIDAMSSTEIVADKDTTFNGSLYKTISNYGFLREDTIKGKAWVYDKSKGREFLIMDLNLSVGDSFPVYDFSFDSTWIYVDSVYYQSGLKQIRFGSYYPNWTLIRLNGSEKIRFIEGSGPNTSIIYQGKFFGHELSSYLLCHYKDNIKVYGNSLFKDTCYVFEVGIDDKNKNDADNFQVIPNPFMNRAKILFKNERNEKINLKILNTLGQEVGSYFMMGNSFDIDEGNFQLPTGIYFLQLKTNHHIQTKKIIKL